MSNLDDLPPDLIAQLRDAKKPSMRSLLLDALSDGVPLSVNDLLIRAYKASGLVFNRRLLLAGLHNLKSSGAAKKVGDRWAVVK